MAGGKWLIWHGSKHEIAVESENAVEPVYILCCNNWTERTHVCPMCQRIVYYFTPQVSHGWR